jgi:ABC-type polysaccharide/polyol phosphate transport system ATPase subunit
MSDDIAIKVEGLSKCYHIYDQPRDRLKQMILPRLQRAVGAASKPYFREFWALKDVSFEVKKGETVGIIGRNGSGKSTLLQMICGTLNPTGGSIQTNGRIAALLELGSGFNPEFTGRENVYMNAAVLGLSDDEIDARFDEIVSFADIGDFIEQPVKTYSSGMMVRLAFAVAVHVNAEILIVDEALAVGDIAFQHKCFQKVQELRVRGTTILLVSHDLGSIVEFCNRAFVLNTGAMVFTGLALESVNQFKQLLSLGSTERALAIPNSAGRTKPMWLANRSPLHTAHPVNPAKCEYGDGIATIFDWGILTTSETPVSAIESNDTVEVLIFVRFHSHCAAPIIGYFITDAKGREIVGTNTFYEGATIGPKEPGDEVCVSFKQRLRVSPGEYFLNIGCSEYIGEHIAVHHRLYRITSLSIYSSNKFVGFFRLDTDTTINILKRS